MRSCTMLCQNGHGAVGGGSPQMWSPGSPPTGAWPWSRSQQHITGGIARTWRPQPSPPPRIQIPVSRTYYQLRNHGFAQVILLRPTNLIIPPPHPALLYRLWPFTVTVIGPCRSSSTGPPRASHDARSAMNSPPHFSRGGREACKCAILHSCAQMATVRSEVEVHRCGNLDFPPAPAQGLSRNSIKKGSHVRGTRCPAPRPVV